MIRKDIINVVGDMECFIDRLLAHTKEENCQHSVSDFLQEYFDNKNKKKNEDERRAASQGLQTRANTTSATPTSQEGEDDHY